MQKTHYPPGACILTIENENTVLHQYPERGAESVQSASKEIKSRLKERLWTIYYLLYTGLKLRAFNSNFDHVFAWWVMGINAHTQSNACFQNACLVFNYTSFIRRIFLIDRLFKNCNNWNSFHKHIVSNLSDLTKNAYPLSLIDKDTKKYLDHKFSTNRNQRKKFPTFITLNYDISSKLQTMKL